MEIPACQAGDTVASELAGQTALHAVHVIVPVRSVYIVQEAEQLRQVQVHLHTRRPAHMPLPPAVRM